MQTRAHIVFEVVGDDGKVLFTHKAPLTDAAAAILGAGQPASFTPPPAAPPVPGIVPLAAPVLSPVRPASDLTVVPPRREQQPIIEDLRVSAEDAQALAAMGLSLHTTKEYSPNPRPVLDSIRPGGDARQRVANGGGAAVTTGTHRNGLVDGQGNPITVAAGTESAPPTPTPAFRVTPPAKTPAKRRRAASASGETPLLSDAPGAFAPDMA